MESITSNEVCQGQEEVVPVDDGHLVLDGDPGGLERLEDLGSNLVQPSRVLGPVHDEVVGERGRPLQQQRRLWFILFSND